MYRKSKSILASPCFLQGLPTVDRPKYRPFSYYVLGGIDVDGDALTMNADISFDDDSEIEAGCSVDGACDPRVSGFDIAEKVGIDAYEKVKEKSQRSAVSIQTDENSSD
ncbi:MAG: hypothetical protein [Chaetfec virus UA24_2292]|nr:MAG: hypothetical protein [Chaetfec virus UA24_2292]